MVKNRWEAEIALISARIINELDTNESEIIGCSEAEIQEIEASQPVPLPAAYRAFLKIMGRDAGDFEGAKYGAIIYYPEVLQLKNSMDTEWHVNKWPFPLPSYARIFSMWQGYQCNYFGDARQENPDIFSYIESSKEPTNHGSFIKYLNEMVSGLVSITIHNAELAQKSKQRRWQIFKEANLSKKREMLVMETVHNEHEHQLRAANLFVSRLSDPPWIKDFDSTPIWTILLDLCRQHKLTLTGALHTVGDLCPDLDETTRCAITLAMLQFLLQQSRIEAYYIQDPTTPLNRKPTTIVKHIETLWEQAGFTAPINEQVWFRAK